MATRGRVHRIGRLDGDGIGPEIVPAAVKVAESAAEASGARIEWVPLPFGARALAEHGTAVPTETLDGLAGLDGWILGPHDNAGYPPEIDEPAPGGVIRRHFDLYANIRPARALRNVAATVPDMDLVIVRENTEGLYSDRNMALGSGEFMPTADVALGVSVFTREACERIARTAFELARTRKQHVTIVHKANVLRMTMGMFRDACLDVSRSYPDVYVETELADSFAANLVRRGGHYDVVVTENLLGDILSDLAGELSGSLGTAPSLNASEFKAMAQAAHGAAPDIAGRNRANPTAIVASTGMLLRRLGEMTGDPAMGEASKRIDHALRTTISAGQVTADLGGRASTGEFTELLCARARSFG